MSDLKQRATSAHIFHHASDIELIAAPALNAQQTRGDEDGAGALLELGDELNMSPLRRVISRVERRELGAVYLAMSGGARAPESDDGRDERDVDQMWEVWATTPMSSKTRARHDAEQPSPDLFFKTRDARAARWNEVLPRQAQLPKLSLIEETAILRTEVYLEDTITVSEASEMEALRSVLVKAEELDIAAREAEGLKVERSSDEDASSAEDEEAVECKHEELKTQEAKIESEPGSETGSETGALRAKDVTESADLIYPERNLTLAKPDDAAQINTSNQTLYYVGCAPIDVEPLELPLLTAIEPPAATPSLDDSADPSEFDSADLSSLTQTLPVSLFRELLEPMYPVLRLIERLHKSGQCLGGFDPTLFGTAHGQTDAVRPRYPLHLYRVADALDEERVDEEQVEGEVTLLSAHPAVLGSESSVYAGYSPPEMYGYYQGVPSEQSDVFSAAMMIYYALTGCPRFIETMRPFSKLPSPHVYRQDLAPELVSVVYRALSPNPSRRHADMSAFLNDVAWALEVAELREARQVTPLRVEAGHEIHIGLLKGQYNPVNQDDLFLGYQSDLDVGLFVVTDGVSICEHGSGDIASGLVREEAAQRWREICRAPVISDDHEETISEINITQHLDAPHRHERVLTTLVNRANRRIGDYINQMIPVFHGPPEGIMAATVVAALVTNGVAMLTSVGDSRIYLIREGHIMNLMYDEDLYTHLLQAKQSPSQAQQSPSAAALVHCIGEFSKTSNQQLKASPISPQLREIKLLPGDQIVLCSDGIPDYAGIDEEDAERRILECVERALTVHHAAFELIALANRGGGGDNLSCVVLKFSERGVRRGVGHV